MNDNRFWMRVINDGDCLVWTGSRNEKGYGLVARGGKLWLAHRYAYALASGDIPDNIYICHSCDNRLCVNPNHLFRATQGDNMREMLSRRFGDPAKRMRCPSCASSQVYFSIRRQRFTCRHCGGEFTRSALARRAA